MAESTRIDLKSSPFAGCRWQSILAGVIVTGGCLQPPRHFTPATRVLGSSYEKGTLLRQGLCSRSPDQHRATLASPKVLLSSAE